MKKKCIAITGGLGFIGSHLADRLLSLGHTVRILDNLDSQVHGKEEKVYIPQGADVRYTSVLKQKDLRTFIEDVDILFHLASKVGVGQSNYQIHEYSNVNVTGTALLIQEMIRSSKKITKVVMTASMTSYGEGMGQCARCGPVKPGIRSVTQLKKKIWNVLCPQCGLELSSIPTDELCPIENNSIYSLTKYAQEQMLMLTGKLYEIPVTSLRCFNVYGPRQSLSNPYTGVSAIFISRLKNNHRPYVYEDGGQSRDFVHVSDVVSALVTAMDVGVADWESINIGSGTGIPVSQLATMIASLMKKTIQPEISYAFRKNDTRACIADTQKARRLLGWKANMPIEEGLKQVIDWSHNQQALDQFSKAQDELAKHKLS